MSKILRVTMLAMAIGVIAIGCKKKEDKPTVMPPVKVEVREISEGTAGEARSYSGTVSSSESTTVSFSVGGTITELALREDQKVTKGQLLGKLRNGDYLNAYNIAAAELAEAQDGYNRLKKLHEANALPDVKWVEMEQKLKQARNAEEMAKRTLDDANLYSPVSGTVTRKFADVGQTVLPAQPIYEIVSMGDLTMDVSLSENEIGNIREGRKAIVIVDALGKEIFEGKVTRKSVVADPLTRSYTVKVSLPNREGKILPGMLGEVMFEEPEAANSSEKGFELPSQAVMLNNDNRWFVWIAKDSLAERRFIEPGEMTPDGVIVKEGLNKGDLVIVAGMRKVGTGTKVTY